VRAQGIWFLFGHGVNSINPNKAVGDLNNVTSLVFSKIKAEAKRKLP
jgi:hypothetical protein